jgi:hypothetical protein
MGFLIGIIILIGFSVFAFMLYRKSDDQSSLHKLQTWFNLFIVISAVLYTGTAIYAFWVTQRAYVAMHPFGSPTFNAGQKPAVTIELQNIGVSPAYRMTYELHGELMPYPYPKKKPLPSGPSVPSEATLFRDVPLSGEIVADDVLKEEDFTLIQDGTHKRYYVRGAARYQSLHLWRYTNFCVVYGGSRPAIPNYKFCDEHNEAD